jgi:UDP-glucose 4-epimerase
MKLAWVTGARGFLGRHVSRHLRAVGWQVVGVGHGEWKREDAEAWGVSMWRDAEIDFLTLRDLAALSGRPDLVFHAAGSASVAFSLEQPLLDFQRTVATTAAVLEAMRTAAPGALIVYPSSAAVYGVVRKGPIAEPTPIAPLSPYGVHKAMAEQLCLTRSKHFGLRCAIIRYFSLYGPGLRRQIVWDLAQKITANPTEVQLHGEGDETRDFLHVEDAARMVPLVARTTADEPVVINGGSGHAVSIRELADVVAGELGEHTAIRFSGKRRHGDPPYYQADVARLAQLGFAPHWTLREGVRDYLAWLRKPDSDGNECP